MRGIFVLEEFRGNSKFDAGYSVAGRLRGCCRNRTFDMARHNKRLEAFRSNPAGSWAPADFEITASQYAIKFRKMTHTHVVFLHPSVPNCVTIPMKNKIRPVHVRAFVAMIDLMDELDR
jgi:hypothetical protein